MVLSPSPDHWLPGFNFNVEEWDAKGLRYETLAICRSLALARAAFAAAVAEKPDLLRYLARIVSPKYCIGRFGCALRHVSVVIFGSPFGRLALAIDMIGSPV